MGKQEEKEKYTPPVMVVIPMETESVIAGSAGGITPDMPITPLGTAANRGSGGYGNSASLDELEDMINEILTIEQ